MDTNITLQIVVVFFVLLVLALYFLYSQKWYSKIHPTNWPILGMSPWLLLNSNRAHDAVTELLENHGGTFEFKGPWFLGMDMVGTCDPANIRYILARNSSNFPNGPAYRKIFEVLGDGILNVESKLWEVQRKMFMSFLHSDSFQDFMMSTILKKLENGLIPILHKFAESGIVFDLQDLLQRFMFDTTSMLILDKDPNSLFSDNTPEMEAFDECTEATFYRHMYPEIVWKIQKLLYFGNEKKLNEGIKNIRRFISKSINLKRQQMLDEIKSDADQDMLTYLLKMESPDDMITFASGKTDKCLDGLAKGIPETLIVDILLNFLFAGRDTLSASMSWLFWLLAMNPHEQQKIYEDIVVNQGNILFDKVFDGNKAKEKISRLNYVHAAMCESLRLFPPVALLHKAPREDDILPNGLKLRKNTKILLSVYSMGRMESIWGKDCLEFKPERWISETTGRIKQEPLSKYAVFGAGPKACVGKEMALMQSRMVVAAIIHDFHIEVAEGHPAAPSSSVVLGKKNGLKVRISKR